jgi:hypothetical protein
MGFQVVWADVVGGKPGRYVILDSALVLAARSRPELRDSLAQLRERAQDDIEKLDLPPAKFKGNLLTTTESRLPNPEHVGWPAVQSVESGRRSLFSRTALVVSRTSSLPAAFIRYSARSQDPRVHPKTGNFAPGTYAAPWSEAPLVPSGFAAVARYALPNPFAARRVYLIVTNSTPQLIGAAAPNYGQAGGGVEVLFPNGAQAMYGTPHLIAAF